MAQSTINTNSQPLGLPNTGTGTDGGDTWPQVVTKLNAMLAELYAGSGVSVPGLFAGEFAAGATKTLTAAANNNGTILLDTAAGSVVTLPAATGSGAKFRFVVSVLATSNSHIVKVANASDTMIGIIQGHRVDTGNAVLGFAAGATDDTITLNRTTTGSVSKGEWIEVEDVAANKWAVTGMLSATGAAFATPFSATV